MASGIIIGPTGPQGPQGKTGLQGSTGPAGPRGPEGLRGVTGADGLPGPSGGPPGPAGPAGPEGPHGLPGIQGVVGPRGPEGPRGLPGFRGQQGIPGQQGLPGSAGAKGEAGAAGAKGETGPAGSTGPMGPQGPQGIPGLGDVNGPSISVIGHIATFSSTTGKNIADSGYAAQDASLINKGFVSLSNSYIGTSQSVAVTELAISNGLATKQAASVSLTNLVALSSTGIAVRASTTGWVARTIVAGSSKISISNGNGISGNPTIDLTESNITHNNLGSIQGGITGERYHTTSAQNILISKVGSNSVTIPTGTALLDTVSLADGHAVKWLLSYTNNTNYSAEEIMAVEQGGIVTYSQYANVGYTFNTALNLISDMTNIYLYVINNEINTMKFSCKRFII